MIGVSGRVSGTFDAAGIRATVDNAARKATTAGARSGAEVAGAVAATRSKTGQMSGIRIEPARRSELGWTAAFVSPTRHAWYQDHGTRAHRRFRRYRSARPGGIRPLNFLYYGKIAGRRTMYTLLGVKGKR